MLARHVGRLDAYRAMQGRTRDEIVANREERARWYSSVSEADLCACLDAARLAPVFQRRSASFSPTT